MPIEWRRLRALRLAWGVALCLAVSFGIGLPVPILAPVFAVLLLAMRSQPLPLRAAPALALLVLLACGSGLLLIPLLRQTTVMKTTAAWIALLENAASEQGSRMTAMDNATRNAGDMINKLSIKYNRQRQAQITKELIEIISGAEAL